MSTTVVTIAVIWLTLSLPLGIAVGKILKRSGESDAESLRNEQAPADDGGFIDWRLIERRGAARY